MSVTRAKVAAKPGARPEGARGEHDAASRVQRMFDDIAPRYDFLNHLLSFQQDRLWRSRAVRGFAPVLARPEARVLDVCCGTGDLSFALAKKTKACVFGVDFSHPMLSRAVHKARTVGAASGGFRGFVEADALRMPFGDATFDLITVGFGFRNLANYESGLGEMFRLLRPGGQVGILEFSDPSNKVFGGLYRLYLRRILPRLGGAISGNRAAYSYLPDSVGKFPTPNDLSERIRAAGFCDVTYRLWVGGAVALHRAVKP